MNIEFFADKKLLIFDDDIFFGDYTCITLAKNFQTKGNSIFISNSDNVKSQLAIQFSVYDGFIIRQIFNEMLHLHVALISTKKEFQSLAALRCNGLKIDYHLCEKDRIANEIDAIMHDLQISSNEVVLLQKEKTFPIDYSKFSHILLPNDPNPIGTFFSEHVDGNGIIKQQYKILRANEYKIEEKKFPIKNGIHALVMDIDGTCTSGQKWFSNEKCDWKEFNIIDRDAIINWQKSGRSAWIITGEGGKIVPFWAEICNIPANHVFLEANFTKLDCLKQIQERERLNLENIAYIGDAINDFGVLSLLAKNNGFAACPANAVKVIKDIENIQLLRNRGGDGAIKEFVERIDQNHIQ